VPEHGAGRFTAIMQLYQYCGSYFMEDEMNGAVEICSSLVKQAVSCHKHLLVSMADMPRQGRWLCQHLKIAK
jgi:hypothetical protein